MSVFSLELYINDFSGIGFFMFFPAFILFIIGIILLIAKQKNLVKYFL